MNFGEYISLATIILASFGGIWAFLAARFDKRFDKIDAAIAEGDKTAREAVVTHATETSSRFKRVEDDLKEVRIRMNDFIPRAEHARGMERLEDKIDRLPKDLEAVVVRLHQAFQNNPK